MATQPPTVNLQPGATGDAVKQLQDYLVSQGLLTQVQVNTGYGTYGPQTTAAVQQLQQRLGVNNSSGPGYYGPQTIKAVQSSSPTNGGIPSTPLLPQGQSAFPPSATIAPPVQTQNVQTTAPTTNTQPTPTTNQASTNSSTTTTNTSTPSNSGLTFNSSYGVTQDQWNQMNDLQRATIAATYTAKQSAYNTSGQQLTFADALTQAAKDPNIISTFADAAKLDAQTFSQTLQQLQQAHTSEAQTNQMQFENDRKQLAEQEAAKGLASSGFRNQAQQQLGQTEGGIVQSSRATLQQNLNNATKAFEAKYGTGATNPATANFLDPAASSSVSLSGQYVPQSQQSTTLTGQTAGGITGSQPVAQNAAVNTKATSLYDLANFTPTIK